VVPESDANKMPLSDATIRSAKPAGKLVKLSDGGGLQLHLAPTGSKLWRMAYRFAGKQRQLAIGPYPVVSLAQARAVRDTARTQLKGGVDPSAKKRLDRMAAAHAAGNTFTLIAAEVIDKKRASGMAKTTLDKSKWLLDIASAVLGRRPIREITAAEVLAVLRPLERKGNLETAKRLRGSIGQVFRLAIATARAESDPTFALRGAINAPRVTPRAAITDAAIFGGLLRAIEGMEGQPTTKAALLLMALLFPRPGDLRHAEWPEFDLASNVWVIPPGRTKMRRQHVAPLSRQAVAALTALREFTGSGRYAFPSIRTVLRPISENTLNAALRRLGYTGDQMCAHGFRATASTLLNESGKWHHDAIERALDHVDEDEVRRAYARGAFWSERVAMAQWWADYLDELRATHG
jgi:integrase